MKTAILIDGGFYRRRAMFLWGDKSPARRASELMAYCRDHLKHEQAYADRVLYRIFYYDCPPLEKTVYHPLKRKGVDFRHNPTSAWTKSFYEELKKQRKVALRMGRLADDFASYQLKPETTKKLLLGKISLDDLTDSDFSVDIKQKGVDMRIGIDIASLAFKRQVDQIILIAGDSDFVPAAKLARREGIDFILDPMWANINPELFEHIDGLNSQWKKRERGS